MSNVKNKRHMNKALKLFLVFVGAILALGLFAFLYIWFRLGSMNNGVPYADSLLPRPTGEIASDPSLELVTDEPDVSYDYYDPDYFGENVPIYKPEPIDEDVLNFLLFGQDRSLTENNGTGGRSDSMLLVSFDRKHSTVKLVSLMRDVWIPIEGHSYNRLNAAYSFGGPGLAVNTINTVFDLDIKNYVLIGFDQFQNIVQSIGGIDLELSPEEVERIKTTIGAAPEEVSDGVYHLNGVQALAHCRNRYTGNGDFSRTERQRKVLMAIFKKASTLSPLKIGGIFNEIIGDIKSNIEPGQMLSIGLEMLTNKNIKFKQARLPFDEHWNYANKDGRSVIEIDFKENTRLLHEFLYGDD